MRCRLSSRDFGFIDIVVVRCNSIVDVGSDTIIQIIYDYVQGRDSNETSSTRHKHRKKLVNSKIYVHIRGLGHCETLSKVELFHQPAKI